MAWMILVAWIALIVVLFVFSYKNRDKHNEVTEQRYIDVATKRGNTNSSDNGEIVLIVIIFIIGVLVLSIQGS